MNRDPPAPDAFPAEAERPATLSILLVEDSPADSRLLQEELREVMESGEIALMVVRTLADALQELRRFEFSCVLLDLGLPDGRGVTNIEALRTVDRHVAVVVLTGHDSSVSAQSALQLGAQDYVIKGQHDCAQLMQRVRHAVQRNRQVAELEDQHRKRFHNASRDPLTGLTNRLLFDDRARQILAQVHRSGGSFAVCFLDLDRFKAVNDSLGHSAGDDVLRRVGEILSDSVRQSDTVARIGGDEFALLLAPVASDVDPAATARRIFNRLLSIRDVAGRPVDLGFSLGVARFPDHGTTLDELMHNADAAMYSAKRAGGGVMMFSDRSLTRGREAAPVMPKPGAEHDAQDFTLYYQPWVDTDQRRFVGLEVHVAWHLQGAADGAASPEPPELPDLSTQDGERIVRSACAQWGQWRHQGFDPGTLALAVSAAQLVDDRFSEFLLAHIGAAGLQPYSVRLEVSATLFGGSEDARYVRGVRRLRDYGFRLLLGGYLPAAGTLYQLSITLLDGVSLDPGLTRRLVDEGVSGVAHRFLLAAMGAAEALNLQVIAKGVDSAETGFALGNAGCRFMQGNWLGAPLVSADVPRHWHVGPQGLEVQ